ncbi:MAG: VTT domain-containing protein, partial [Terrimonas sp.]|nr:VTT domain-containing protein [Terrimonas sp.]
MVSADGFETVSTNVAALQAKPVVNLHKKFTWKDLLNPMFYIVNGGLWLLLFIVFAETGLFVGFFLPGDSLLFVAGIYSSDLMHEFYKAIGIDRFENEWLDLFLLVGLISLMGVIGNMLGYWFGRKIGPSMFHWKDRFLFKKKYLHDAHDFFEKHGGGAIVFARFLPIIRTFAPIVAGIVGMDRKKFMFYNIVGCIAWVVSMIFAGHFLQIWVRKQFGFELKDHLEAIVIVIVLV